jgi:hypothetical protein
MGASVGVAALSRVRTRLAPPTCRPRGPSAYGRLTSVAMDPRVMDPPPDHRPCAALWETGRMAMCLASRGTATRALLRLVSHYPAPRVSLPLCQLDPPRSGCPPGHYLFVPSPLIHEPSKAGVRSTARQRQHRRRARCFTPPRRAPVAYTCPQLSIEDPQAPHCSSKPCGRRKFEHRRTFRPCSAADHYRDSTAPTTAKNRSMVGPIPTLATFPPFSGHRSPLVSSLRHQTHIYED